MPETSGNQKHELIETVPQAPRNKARCVRISASIGIALQREPTSNGELAETDVTALDHPPRVIVLVVEDEPILRMCAVDFLEDAGYGTVEAPDADVAIEILNSRPDIRIVFTDIDMPGSMDGIKLAAAIRHRWPPVEIIITSGHRRPRDADMPERGIFFPKPYSEGQLIDAVSGFRF